ncbi:MBOAT family O-acyltransferase [Enterovirga aerilata]|uniref:Probable alginate O-acetylase AlgI n=1 Tax=Enterovirga aerilata TaxID=2730920 RepID=A0A849IC25_9HYPH|nr:MBOAT family protein [Enterovirga sp. DB1703]NNM74958.1 MBOAT family protein [Enterovirga sp. DB1703]
MLFNSLVFLLLFLPAAWAGYAAVVRTLPRGRTAYLVLVSFVFYASFDLRFVPVLAASILLNWLLAAVFVRSGRGPLITIGIAANLLLLGIFKYLDFFGGLLALIPGVTPPRYDLALPLGISFFTFQHVMYLSDLRSGRTRHAGLLDYALYVAFFPRVIAGPLVRPADLLPQLAERAALPAAETVARGLALLVLGLAKKVFVGDPLGAFVDPIYARVATGAIPTIAEAWQATLGYTFQLYFDFSGYTDMALGLALLFGIVLPQNFDAPYRAVSIQDFWRRWHITLSLFLRDYLYIPFGGNRHGVPRQVLALFATMALGGLWHGAGWTFVAWGALHGIALGTHLIWRKAGRAMPDALGWACTFAFVSLAWVLFRAPDFAAATAIYAGLAGLSAGGLGQPSSDFWQLAAIAAALATLGPTAWSLSRKLPPLRWAAAALGLVLVAVLLKVGDDANADFIYAQF